MIQKIKETDIQVGIIAYLEITGCLVLRFNNVGMYDPTTQRYRRNVNRKGISDIIAFKKGQFLAIEVKTPKAMSKVNKVINGLKTAKNDDYWHIYSQYEFIKDIRNHGGIGFFADSVDMVMENLRKAVTNE